VGKKGDRASKEVQAKEMYAYGLSLTDIAVALDISVTSLARWKHDTKDPNKSEDEWDLARVGRRDHIDMIKATYQEQLAYVSELSPRQRSPKDSDLLVKLHSIIISWEKFELEKVAKLMLRIDRTASLPEPEDTENGETVKEAGVSADTIARIRKDVLRMNG